MDMERLNRQLAFLREIDKAKSVFRNTLLLDGSRRENDAEHSWHMAVAAMLFMEYANDQNVDLLKVLKMIMLHDTVEIYAGDTLVYDTAGCATQEQREKEAAKKLFCLLPVDQAQEFADLWAEFDAYETPESAYAHLVDTFMPVYHSYVTGGISWHENHITRDMVLKRNCHMEKGSEKLWTFMQSLVEDAVEKGFLDK